MSDTIIKIEHVSKEYRLGAIGGGTLKGDLQSLFARIRGKEDPNSRIGQDVYAKNQRFLALDDVTFSVKKGERVGIIGHNGAGKSTLLKLLSRVTAPTTGSISYNGRIASMLEVGTGFHPELTGRENIYLNGAILGMSKAEITKKFDDIVAFAEMEKFVDTPVKRYSSGMYVKLAFAVAAHLDSDILVMDEVLAVGDMKFQQKCLGKMDDVSKNEGRTVLYVSHNMNTIRQLCTRCIVMDHGKVIFDGDVEEAIEIYMGNVVRRQCQYEYTREYHTVSLSNDSFVIKSLRINTEDNNACFDCGDPITIALTCYSEQPRKGVKFRFEAQYQDGTQIATSIMDEGVDFGENETKSISFTIDTKYYPTGNYCINIVAYLCNEFGYDQFLDGVYPGMWFEISDKLNQHSQLVWMHRYWGHVMLKNVVMDT